MKIKQVKLAQTVPGSSSNLLEADKFELKFESSKLTVKYKSGPHAEKYGTFHIFPANIAWMEEEKSTEAPAKK